MFRTPAPGTYREDAMKTYFAAALLLMATCAASAQTPADSVGPFHGHNALAGWADLAFYNVDPDTGLHIGYRLFVNDEPQNPFYAKVSPLKVWSADGVIGNFLMRTPEEAARDQFICGALEVVNAISMKMRVSLYVSQFVNDIWTVVPTPIDSVFSDMSKIALRMDVRMAAGAFFRDEAKGFAIAYPLPDGTERLTLRLYRLDSLTRSPVLVSSTYEGTLPKNVGAQSFFDVAAGDFDGDGLDEILTAKSILPAWMGTPGNNQLLTLRFLFHLYDVDWTTGELVSKHWNNVDMTVDLAGKQNAKYPGVLNQLTLSAGDLNGDGIDEGVLGVSVGTKDLYTYSSGWCQPFTINRDLSGWSIDPSKRMTLEPCLTAIGLFTFPPAPIDAATVTGLSLATADMDAKGMDELLCGWMEKTYIFKFMPDLSAPSYFSWPTYTKRDYDTHHSLAFADINADTLSARPVWTPEVITSAFAYTVIEGLGKDDANSPWFTTLGWADTNRTIPEFKKQHMDPYLPGMPPTRQKSGGIFAGALRGNGIRFGTPRWHKLDSVVEPLIILSAPPMHIDVIGDSTYDICGTYPISGGSIPWETRYVSTTTNGATASTTINSDWAVSATASAGGSFLGIGVKASLTAKYGEKFSKTQMGENTTTIREVQTALWDDMLLTMTTNYDLWEYPVYVKGRYKTDVATVVPHPLGMHWTTANQSEDGAVVRMQHEPGNLLSYLDRDDPALAPGVGTVIAKKNYTDIILGGGANSWSVDYGTLTTLGSQTTSSYGFSSSFSIGGFGADLAVEGSYNHESFKTHTTTLKSEISMGISLGTLKAGSSSAVYSVFPYTCWSGDGPLMIDYLVRLPTATPGGSFWNTHYNSKPDLTFNCYYRHRAKKDATKEPTMEQWTKEIRLTPAHPKPGDTVWVKVRLRNYSLKSTTAPVNLRLYLGSPSSQGRTIRSVNGDTLFTTSSPVLAREGQEISFLWRVPAGLSVAEDTIVAVVDPGNAVDEIRKDNNRAWNVFPLHDHATDVLRRGGGVVRAVAKLPEPLQPDDDDRRIAGHAGARDGDGVRSSGQEDRDVDGRGEGAGAVRGDLECGGHGERRVLLPGEGGDVRADEKGVAHEVVGFIEYRRGTRGVPRLGFGDGFEDHRKGCCLLSTLLSSLFILHFFTPLWRSSRCPGTPRPYARSPSPTRGSSPARGPAWCTPTSASRRAAADTTVR